MLWAAGWLERFPGPVSEVKRDALAVLTAWGTIDLDRTHLQALRSAFPRLPLVAIGACARYCCELLLGGASHVLLGDPGLALPELFSKPLPSPGLVRARDLLPKLHNHAGLLKDPALLPRPAWDSIPWQSSYGFLTVWARGCDDRCRFCAYATVQGHSPARPPKMLSPRWSG